MKSVGLLVHHKGISVDIAAYTLGATWIERNFILDRTWKVTKDHAASLKPDGIRRLKSGLIATYKALKFKDVGFLEVEKTGKKITLGQR